MSTSKKNQSIKSVVTVACPAPADPFGRAYASIHAQIAAVAPARVRGYSLDASYAASVAQAAVARCARLRSEFAALPRHDRTLSQRIATYSLALLHAQGQVLASSAPTDGLAKQCEEAGAYIDRFGAVAQLFVAFGELDPKVVEPVRSQRKRSYRECINALIAYALVIEELRAKFGERVMATVDDVAKARALAATMLGTLGARVNATGTRDHWIEQRARVAALLIDAYAELRRGVEFVRFHEGDAADFVPSLYVAGARSKKPAGDAGSDSDEGNEGTEGETEGDDDGGKRENAAPEAKGARGSNGTNSAKGAAKPVQEDDAPHGPPGSITNPLLR